MGCASPTPATARRPSPGLGEFSGSLAGGGGGGCIPFSAERGGKPSSRNRSTMPPGVGAAQESGVGVCGGLPGLLPAFSRTHSWCTQPRRCGGRALMAEDSNLPSPIPWVTELGAPPPKVGAENPLTASGSPPPPKHAGAQSSPQCWSGPIPLKRVEGGRVLRPHQGGGRGHQPPSLPHPPPLRTR